MSVAYAISFQAVLSGTATAGSAGDVLLPSTADGLYVRATAANRGTRRSTGIALSSYVAAGVVDIQQEGEVSATLSGLGAGTATYVRVSATGSLERVASPGGTDDVVGWCETDGTLHLRCGQIPGGYGTGGGGGGGATLPIDMADPASVTGVLAAANGGTGSSSLPAGGIAGLTAMAAGDAAAQAAAEATAAAGIVTERTATATLTSKTISGASNTITNVSLTTGVTGTLPVGNGGTGITSLGAGVATFLGTPSGANLATALTTALPATKGGTGLTSLGTNVATFLGTPSGANLASALTTALPVTKGGTGATAATGSGNAVLATSPTLTTPVINGQVQGPVVAVAAMAIDWTLGTGFTKTLAAGANTFTWSGSASNMSINVRVTGAASTLTWPAGIRWAGGAAPTQTASGTDVYTFWHDGTNIYGAVQQAMA